MSRTVTAYRLRSALGEINIVLDILQTPDHPTTWNGLTPLEEAVDRLQRAATILQSEALQVESSKTPTLRIDNETLDSVLDVNDLY